MSLNSLEDNKALIRMMWSCVYARDWQALTALLSEDCWHDDVPAPDPGVRGAKNIVGRLRIGFDLIERFDHEEVRMVAEGNQVAFEHRERWYFETGEQVENQLVSIHEVRDGKVTLWLDYWDINNMFSNAPQWWVEKVAEESPGDFT